MENTKLPIHELVANADSAAALLKALSNESRLLILCNLVAGEKSVGELNELIPLSQSALSQHLARLRKDDLVSIRKEAQTVFYKISSVEAEKVIHVLHESFCKTK